MSKQIVVKHDCTKISQGLIKLDFYALPVDVSTVAPVRFGSGVTLDISPIGFEEKFSLYEAGLPNIREDTNETHFASIDSPAKTSAIVGLHSHGLYFRTKSYYCNDLLSDFTGIILRYHVDGIPQTSIIKFTLSNDIIPLLWTIHHEIQLIHINNNDIGFKPTIPVEKFAQIEYQRKMNALELHIAKKCKY